MPGRSGRCGAAPGCALPAIASALPNLDATLNMWFPKFTEEYRTRWESIQTALSRSTGNKVERSDRDCGDREGREIRFEEATPSPQTTFELRVGRNEAEKEVRSRNRRVRGYPAAGGRSAGRNCGIDTAPAPRSSPDRRESPLAWSGERPSNRT